MPSPWAGEPFALISTLPFSQDTSRAAYYVATQMALAHNGILRGLNAIYLQALHLPHDDHGLIKDFLTYCQCWCASMHHHHDAEENNFFPALTRLTKEETLMSKNVEQHRAFTPGFEQFDEYCKTCTPQKYDGEEVRKLIQGFAMPLCQHLHDGVVTLRELNKYNSDGLRKAYGDLEKILMASDTYRTGPLVFGTADRAFEGGIHNFPAVPFFVPYVLHYYYERRYRGAWRFNPCTTWRDRRSLSFVPEHEGAN